MRNKMIKVGLGDKTLSDCGLPERKGAGSYSTALQKSVDSARLLRVAVSVERSFDVTLDGPLLWFVCGVWSAVHELDNSNGNAQSNTMTYQG